jgi:Protein of unknown function (DUF2793)
MTDSPNLALPYIDGGEAQPYVTHNDALRALDAMVQLAVIERDLTAPPGSPVDGQRWIVAASPTGAWAGHATQVAAWQDGAWEFYVPRTGWFAYVLDEGTLLAWNGTAWVDAMAILTAFQNLTLLGVGTTADSTNPFSAKLNNALWVAKTVAEGGDGNLRYKLSKEAAADTLSFLFQDNFSGRAEIGLTGDDNFHFKVSPDGSAWSEAIVVDKTTGKLTLLGFTDTVASRTLLAAAPSDALAANGMQVNGAMEVSQENGAGTVTLTATGSLQTKYLLDGVMAAYRGSFVATAQQVATPFVGGRYALKFTVGTAESALGANDELSVFIPVEGVRVSRLALGTANAAAQSLGFWFQAHRTGTYSGSIRNVGKTRSYPFTFTVGAADTPTWVSLSGAGAIPGDTSGTWAIDTSVGLYVSICLAGGSSRVGTANAWAGSDYSGATGTTNGVAATSDVFYIGNLISLPGIELPDSTRAAFIMRPFDQELLLCKRYWEKSYDYATAPGTANVGNGIISVRVPSNTIAVNEDMGSCAFRTQKRTVPTVTLYGFGGTSGTVSNPAGTDLAANSGGVTGGGENGFTVRNTSGGSITTTGTEVIFHWKADARL